MIVIIRNVFKNSRNYKLRVFVISYGYSVKNAIMSVLTMTTKIISRSSKNLISRFPKYIQLSLTLFIIKLLSNNS